MQYLFFWRSCCVVMFVDRERLLRLRFNVIIDAYYMSSRKQNFSHEYIFVFKYRGDAEGPQVDIPNSIGRKEPGTSVLRVSSLQYIHVSEGILVVFSMVRFHFFYVSISRLSWRWQAGRGRQAHTS